MPVRRLIVNADDFGLTDGINRAVLGSVSMGCADLHNLDGRRTTLSRSC
jgi:hypothetical protein